MKGSHPHFYNESALVCLPRKATRTMEDGTSVFTSENTRPLSLVNCDNRIVASAARLRWEAHLSKWILPRQQGFLQGRSIVANLLDVDAASMLTSLRRDTGACLLMDFSAAFPSISQECMFKALQHIGLPSSALNLLTSLYSQSHCRIKVEGKLFDGFSLDSGVRQGCPLSPLIYATVAEILLDRIESTCIGALVRAYADDTALVCEDFWTCAPHLQRVFAEFGRVSGLHLNLQKCIIIPLYVTPLEEFQQQLGKRVPQWRQMQIANKGKYLGFMIGPEKNQDSWTEPIEKYMRKCGMWQERGLGLQYSALVYNTFAVSTLGYIAQLENPPGSLCIAEAAGLRKVARGPWQWASSDDLWRLKEQYGQSRSFKSVKLMSEAAKVRVREFDPACRNPYFQAELNELKSAINCPCNLQSFRAWANWYTQSFAIVVDNAHSCFTHSVCSLAQVRAAFDKQADCSIEGSTNFVDEFGLDDTASGLNSNTSRKKSTYRARFQGLIYSKLLMHDAPDLVHRVRYKHIRWELGNPCRHIVPTGSNCKHLTPAWKARRSLASLLLLQGLVPPRVCAAVFSTMWNRWTTFRRMQQRSHPSNRCMLGCASPAEEDLEHYCCCPRVQELYHRHLNLPRQDDYKNLHTFLLCNANIRTQEQLINIALAIYAVCNATNTFRRKSPPIGTNIYEALVQWTKEGIRHHAYSTRILDNNWNPHYTTTPLPPIPSNL